MLTEAQRKRLAKEMRGLAMECVVNGPEMEDTWCGCAIGISLKRAGLLPVDIDEQCSLGQQIDSLLRDGKTWTGIVSIATRERAWRGNPTAVVFPLLALADELEASAASLPKAAP